MPKGLVQGAYVAIFICVCIFGGFRISQYTKSTTSTMHVASRPTSAINRDPAAIRHNYDFSLLAGAELNQATKQRLITGATVVHNNSDVGVALGDFVVRGGDGQKTFACQQFGTIVLQFEGDGSAVDGHKPEMEVEGACEVAGDINTISPLWIPVAKILGEPVADGEFDFRDQRPVRVRFANLVHEWPTAWRLKGVRMLDPNSSREVSISEQDLKKINDKPLILSFE